MDITNRNILIVGGTSGIGLALGRAFVAAGSNVFVAGRRHLVENGIASFIVDVTDRASVTSLCEEVLSAQPGLDTVVTMSGIMEPEDVRDPAHLEVAERTIATNLLGTIQVASAFTPHLIERGGGAIVTVSSGVAFVPFPPTPTYGATKAGVHSYTESLREQLRGTGVEVVELVPPATATTLMGLDKSPNAMPVNDYVAETVALLSQDPTPQEILVERVQGHRRSAVEGTYADRLTANAAALPAFRAS